MKKIICTLLTTLLILSLLVTPASATSQSNTQDAVLHFDANSAIKHWQPFSKVYCHIWEYDGEAFFHGTVTKVFVPTQTTMEFTHIT